MEPLAAGCRPGGPGRRGGAGRTGDLGRGGGGGWNWWATGQGTFTHGLIAAHRGMATPTARLALVCKVARGSITLLPPVVTETGTDI